MRRISVAALFAGLLLAGTSTRSLAATNIYMYLDGATQGAIEGEVGVQGFEDWIEVLDFHHLIHRDYSSSPVGVKLHEEIVLTVKLDKATPKMMGALNTQELMNTCWIHFRRSDGGAGQETYYTIELQGARISAVEPIFPDNFNTTPPTDLARIRLAYAEITVNHIPGGTSATLVQGGKGL